MEKVLQVRIYAARSHFIDRNINFTMEFLSLSLDSRTRSLECGKTLYVTCLSRRLIASSSMISSLIISGTSMFSG